MSKFDLKYLPFKRATKVAFSEILIECSVSSLCVHCGIIIDQYFYFHSFPLYNACWGVWSREKSNMKHVICFSSWIWINKWEHVLVCFWTTSTRLSLHTCVEKKPEYNKASHFLKVVQECIYAQIAHINWQWHAFIYQCLKQSSVTIYHFLIGRYHHDTYCLL